MDQGSTIRDLGQLLAARTRKGDVPVACVAAKRYKSWVKHQPKGTRAWLTSIGFKPDAGRVALVPDRDGALGRVVLGCGDDDESARPWPYAALPGKLPRGRYVLEPGLDLVAAEAAALGWLLATYRFDRYRPSKQALATLVWPKDVDRGRCLRMAQAIALGRDLINTPAEDMGPEHLAAAAEAVAAFHGADYACLVGEDLLAARYPAIYTVGRASTRPPRLIDIRWGDPSRPKLTLVGKGVCFDTGGLDLKNSAGMKLMKKDMGGAASVLGLAHLIMGSDLPVHLRVLIPAVENSVAGNAMRPGDVITTRKGLTVEVGNTDAEGRLILCDALAEADREDPDLIVDIATLTGAARVALGTDLPALFATDAAMSQAILDAGLELDDPLWAMPLFRPYRKHLESAIADLNNCSSSAYGGAITAALFLQAFVGSARSWVHIDSMGWNLSGRPGRPAGGEPLGIRAVFVALERRYGAAATTPTKGSRRSHS